MTKQMLDCEHSLRVVLCSCCCEDTDSLTTSHYRKPVASFVAFAILLKNFHEPMRSKC